MMISTETHTEKDTNGNLVRWFRVSIAGAETASAYAYEAKGETPGDAARAALAKLKEFTAMAEDELVRLGLLREGGR